MNKSEICRKSELTKKENNAYLKSGFIEVEDEVDGDTLLIHPDHWHVCVTGERYTFMFDNTYLLPLTEEAKDFCDYEDDGIVP